MERSAIAFLALALAAFGHHRTRREERVAGSSIGSNGTPAAQDWFGIIKFIDFDADVGLEF